MTPQPTDMLSDYKLPVMQDDAEEGCSPAVAAACSRAPQPLSRTGAEK